MASFFCHVFGVTKQVRLERIVRCAAYWPGKNSALPVERSTTTRNEQPGGAGTGMQWNPISHSRPSSDSLELEVSGWKYERSTPRATATLRRSEEHTSELQSLMRKSYAVFFWKKKTK